MSTTTYESGLAQRGQMTLPKSLRDQYNLKEGQIFTIFDMDGTFLIVPKKSHVDEICNRLRDELLDSGTSLDDLIADLRSKRQADGRVG